MVFLIYAAMSFLYSKHEMDISQTSRRENTRNSENFKIEKAMGFADLTIAIKTKRGIAEYPSISLAALSKAEIEQ